MLGAILCRNEILPLLPQLTPEAFFHLGHRRVFEAMRDLAAAGDPIDEITLETALAQRGVLDAIGGLPFLSRLTLIMPTAARAENYAEIVLEKSDVRLLMLALSEALEQGYGDYGTLAEYQATVLAKVSEVIHRASRTGPRPAREIIQDLGRDLERRYRVGDGITGVPTGFADVDDRLAGLQPTDLIILAARPSMGKTALALCMAKRAAEHGYPVVFFSLEMAAIQLMERLLCAEASISTSALRKGTVKRNQSEALGLSLPRLGELPLAIDETASLSIHDVHARARRFATEYAGERPGLVVIDYLQLMRGTTRHRVREQEIAEIARGLKALAKGLGWPVLALSQLNRNLESRGNKRPQLSDLRESGAIEQDADIVMFLYRDVVYNDEAADRHEAELIIGKHRAGKAGTVLLRFDAEYTRFADASHHRR